MVSSMRDVHTERRGSGIMPKVQTYIDMRRGMLATVNVYKSYHYTEICNSCLKLLF